MKTGATNNVNCLSKTKNNRQLGSHLDSCGVKNRLQRDFGPQSGPWATIPVIEIDQDIKEIRRFMQLITAINHMGINPDPNVSMASDAGVSTDVSTGDVSMPRQLDLFLAQGSSGGTD